MNKTVQLATKPKRAPPKAKYIDPIVKSTFNGDGAIAELVRALGTRLRDENPTVCLKALIVTHLIMRGGSLEPTFGILVASNPLTNGIYATPNSAAYAAYLIARTKSYGNLKRDVIRDNSDRRAANRLRSLGVEQGLLRETRETQRMIAGLVEAKFYLDDIDDEVAMTALRLLVKDLLVLFTAVNEGVINVLEHYFEMSHVDATTALKIYKTFCRDTEKVVAFLGVAKKLHNVLNVPIPNLKHAPVSLVSSLEEYLNDPNFHKNREEYKENKRIADGGAPAPKAATPVPATTSASTSASSSAAPAADAPASKPAASFTDFFDSIESSQTSMFNPSTNSPSTAYFQQQAAFNPFVAPQPTGFGAFGGHPQQQALAPQMTGFVPSPFGAQPMPQPFLQPQVTGSPFALVPQKTGMRNPFNPAPGEVVAPKPPPGPSMNSLAAAAFGQQQQQAQQPPLAPQPTGSPFGGMPNGGSAHPGLSNGGSAFGNGLNAFSSPMGGSTPGATSQPPAQALTPAKTGGLMGNIASEFAFSSPSPSTPPPAASSTVTPSSGASSTPAFSASPLRSSTLPPLNTPLSGGSNFLSPNGPPNGAPLSPLRSQSTGFGGSTMKPFQPTSSFGSKLADELGPSTVPSLSSQPTGFTPSVSLGPQPTGLTSQTTGSGAFNPFRSSVLPPLSSTLAAGLTSQATGAFGSQAPTSFSSQPAGAFSSAFSSAPTSFASSSFSTTGAFTGTQPTSQPQQTGSLI
ncbi:ENTH domain containing protein [Pseudohyphozyma bogoriensis]|nr:ENTH domain containing protein [Pseudohyphozyma bogoriensis]